MSGCRCRKVSSIFRREESEQWAYHSSEHHPQIDQSIAATKMPSTPTNVFELLRESLRRSLKGIFI